MRFKAKEFPTGGTAHEPKCMIRLLMSDLSVMLCRNSEADSTVWMKEDNDRLTFLNGSFVKYEKRR